MNYYPGTSQLGLAQLGAMWLGYAPPQDSAGGPALTSTSQQVSETSTSVEATEEDD